MHDFLEIFSDTNRVSTWKMAAQCFVGLANICESIGNKNGTIVSIFVKNSVILYKEILASGMKVLEINVKYQTEDVVEVLKLFQR